MLFALASLACTAPIDVPGETLGDSTAHTGTGATGTGTTAPTQIDLSPLSLHWVSSATGIDADRLRAGFDWNLTLLGALPPSSGEHLTIQTAESDSGPGFDLTLDVTFDPALAGFPSARQAALTDALLDLRAWQDQVGTVDAGRLFMLTLHEPWRYYSITGACRDLEQWREVRGTVTTDRYDVLVSLLAAGDRQIHLPPASEAVASIAFVVETSTQDLGPAWRAQEYETIDMMDSSQQRFATYTSSGALQPQANDDVVPAGQPGNCIWCHEGNLMYGTSENPSSADAVSYTEWERRIFGWRDQLVAWRASLPTGVDFVDVDAHSWGEQIVREFLLPTVDRAAAEWGLDEPAAWDLVQAEGMWLGTDSEWPARGDILLRAEVDAVRAERTGLVPPRVQEDARHLDAETGLRGEEWAAWLDCSTD